jgi:MOSC domain-containing protein YiiM
MNSGILVSLQVGKPQLLDPGDGSPFQTSIVKTAVLEPVRLTFTDLEGNAQADLRHHGGRDKAVCSFSVEHLKAAGEFLGAELCPGAFGENFSLQGMVEGSICLGDRYSVGNAIVEVSQPRQPCANLGKRWRNARLMAWMIDNGYSGWYFRVLQEGTVAAGMKLIPIDRPFPDWTIARLNDLIYRKRTDVAALRSAVDLPPLSKAWRHALQKLLST